MSQHDDGRRVTWEGWYEMNYCVFIESPIASLILSYNVKTNAPPVPLSIFDSDPLKKAPTPSSLVVFIQQSNVFLYITSVLLSPDCIIMRLLTVSKGYDTTPATVVTVCEQCTRVYSSLQTDDRQCNLPVR